MEKVKNTFFNLNGDSTTGSDGLTIRFYRSFWEVVGNDMFKMVKVFFRGNTLPKSITHTNLVLLISNISSFFTNFRPIRLTNFINKIISRIVHDRIEGYLSKLISFNESSFVKSRNIIENVLLTQEIVTEIPKRGKTTNIVIKFDMTKAYDRASWFYLMKR